MKPSDVTIAQAVRMSTSIPFFIALLDGSWQTKVRRILLMAAY